MAWIPARLLLSTAQPKTVSSPHAFPCSITGLLTTGIRPVSPQKPGSDAINDLFILQPINFAPRLENLVKKPCEG